MHGLAWVALAAVVACVIADEVPLNESIIVDEGSTFKLGLDNRKGAKGFQRKLNPGDVQTFWICDGTNKDKCGAWVDDKGKKIPGMSKTSVDNDNVLTIEKAQVSDNATYQVLPDNGNNVKKDVLIDKKKKESRS